MVEIIQRGLGPNFGTDTVVGSIGKNSVAVPNDEQLRLIEAARRSGIDVTKPGWEDELNCLIQQQIREDIEDRAGNYGR